MTYEGRLKYLNIKKLRSLYDKRLFILYKNKYRTINLVYLLKQTLRNVTLRVSTCINEDSP